MEKKCKKCNVVKDVSEFYKAKTNKDGFRNECKLCAKENKAEYYLSNQNKFLAKSKEYYKANKEIIRGKNNKEKKKEYYKANKEKILLREKKYREENKEEVANRKKRYREENKEDIAKKRKTLHKDYNKQYAKRYYEANKEKINNYTVEYIKSKTKTDNFFRLKLSVRGSVTRYLKYGKSKRTREIIGIGFKEFQDYLEVEYTEGLHLDHIIPLSWANNDEEVYILNHYSNFQIITAEENLAKKDTYCKSENLKKVLDNHNDLTKLNKIIERNSDKIK